MISAILSIFPNSIISYISVLNAEHKKINGEIFNVGYKNQSVNELAADVREIIGDDIKIVNTKSDDNRSYHINSDKIKKMLGYSPKRSIELAVEDLCNAFGKNLIPNSFEDDFYFNVNRLKRINAK